MSPASTRTLFSSPPRQQSCLSSTWPWLHSTTAPGKRPTLSRTPTWLTPQRRWRPSTFLQISYQRRSWLEIIFNLWSKCKKETTMTLTFKTDNCCILRPDRCYQMYMSCRSLRALAEETSNFLYAFECTERVHLSG
uniref:Uncharacterized protein n=1 Tax=Gasterosteus aculeatus TaxID=69293 RepID=G3NPC2_GASAC